MVDQKDQVWGIGKEMLKEVSENGDSVVLF